MSLSLTDSFIAEHLSDDVASLVLHRNRYSHLSDTDFYFALRQIEGRQLLAGKVPSLPPHWWYPPRLSCEQCSSALTAEYKAHCLHQTMDAINQPTVLYDLTGGAGVDTLVMSRQVDVTHYVEQNTELCRLARHNFEGLPITVHETSAEQFLSSLTRTNQPSMLPVFYLDPARRDTRGNKVFRLEDCSPNAVEILRQIDAISPKCVVLIKLSPMLDLSAALNALPRVFETHVVAVKNEVKELLLLAAPTNVKPTITAIDLTCPAQVFSFARDEELTAQATIHTSVLPLHYLYEPSAAILKAGAYRLVAQRWGLSKLDSNTHLYMSDEWKQDFPGRCWRIVSTQIPKDLQQANVLTRNYVLTPEQLKKKLHLKDGGDLYVIGARMNAKPCLFLAERLK
ncbi:MAG: hypothetical protein KBS42_05765 [Bacteroidales bacterium]|nr:hypothetical protein [Candidatus Colicola coprequi]